jgi:hypothetical protein
VHRAGSVAICVAVCMAPAVALADRPDPASAEALFREGRQRAEAGDWAKACPLFAESNRLDFALGTSMNLAACEEHIGKLASAWERYGELLEALPPNDDRRAFVAGSVARLRRVVPRLTILLATPLIDGTTLVRDGVDLGSASVGVDLPVDPGEHSIVVAAPGRAARTYVVALAPGQRLTLPAEAGEPIANAGRTGAPHRTEARTAGWILGGIGVGALAVGTFLGVRALSERSASDGLCAMGVCRDRAGLDDYDAAKSSALGADIALAAGAVSLAIGGYLLVTSMIKARPSPAAASFHVSPSSGVGFSW